MRLNILKLIEKQQGKRGCQIAEKLGISKASYSLMSSGKRPISKKVALSIHKNYGIPLETILLHPEVYDKSTKRKPTGTDGK